MTDVDKKSFFAERKTVEQVEESLELAPKFDENGLIPVITTDYTSGEVLMHAYMNQEALIETIKTRKACYWSRSRQALWRKGAGSGLIQKVKQILLDDDQDTIWLRVEVIGGASCHVGYRSCFYRQIELEKQSGQARLVQLDVEKVYAGVPNPTKL